MAFAAKGSGVRSDINITPLVDVVLVLLIIFMVLTPSLLREIDMKIPNVAERTELETNVLPSSAEEVIVSVGPTGRIQVNHEPIAASHLAERIREEMAIRTEKRVFFDIDDDAVYADAMHVMDLCRGAGAKTLGLMAK